MAQVRLSPIFLSPKEWTVAEKWHQDEIPLMVVFRGIDKALRHIHKSSREFKKVRITLQYCEKPVRQALKSHEKAQSLFPDEIAKMTDGVPRPDPVDAETYYVLNRLETLSKELDALLSASEFAARKGDVENLSNELKTLLEKTRAARKDKWLERVQIQLASIDQRLLKIARSCIEKERLAEIKASIAVRASGAAKLDRTTMEYLLDGAVRDELDLIPISLFDI